MRTHACPQHSACKIQHVSTCAEFFTRHSATLCSILQQWSFGAAPCVAGSCRELQNAAYPCVSARIHMRIGPYSRKQGRLFCVILLTLCSSHFIFISVYSLCVAHCTNLAISATHTTINLTKHTANTSTR